MCRLKIIFLFVFVFIFFPFFSLSQTNFGEDFSLTNYQVDGNRSQSFYSRNQIRFLYEGKFNFSYQNSFYGDIFYRSTDDTLIDPQNFSLEHFCLSYKNNGMDFLVGDYYAYFTDYSVNNSLKGFSFKSARFSLLAGVDIARWEDLWEERADNSEPRRYVWGISVAPLLTKQLKISLNYGEGRDDRAYFQDTDIYYPLIKVASVNVEANLWEYLSFVAELSTSFRKKESSDLKFDPKRDNAYRFLLDFSEQRSIFRLEYKRSGPYFETTGGLSEQDLESIRLDMSLRCKENISLFSYFYKERDNLKDLKSTTSKRINPGFRLEWQVNQDLNLNFGFDNLKEFTTDESTNATTKTFDFGISKNFKGIASSLTYSLIRINDKGDASQKRKRHNIALALSGNVDFSNMVLGWSFSEDVSWEKVISVNDKNIFLMHSFEINATFFEKLNLDMRINISDNNYYTDENDSNIFSYSFSLSYPVKENLVFSLNYEQNDNYYTEENNDYSERKLTMKLSWRF